MQMSQTVKNFTLGFIALSIVVAGYFTASIPQAKALTSLANVQPGDLVKGQSLPAVYFYGADGYRYVFPNDKAYFSWYQNFNNIKTISDADLTRLQIGGNVTYRPGVKMVKIQSDPKTYAVERGGVLRHITSEQVAIALYGTTWNRQIDDIPDGFFGNYRIGTPINNSGEYNPEAVRNANPTINADKQLVAPAVINFTGNGFSPVDVTISVGGNVRFVNNSNTDVNVIGEDLNWGTGTLRPGQSRIVRFRNAGTFTFFNGLDSSDTGAVFVQ
jgi:plastocyanin